MFMAGSKKLTHWQSSADSKMKDVIKRPDFQRDVKSIRSELDNEQPVLNERSKFLVHKYDLPRVCFVLVRDYLRTNDYVPIEELQAPIMLLSSKDNYVGPDYDGLPLNLYLEAYPNDHVLLELTGEIQQKDIIDFVKSNWSLIEDKLKLIAPSRPGAVKNKQIDKLHLKVLSLREDKKLSYNDIAAQTGLNPDNIKQILYRMRRPGRHQKSQK